MTSLQSDAATALATLLGGNRRHALGTPAPHAPGEHPGVLAAVLTCSDLGVAPEAIFDTQPGRLIVTSTAAHLTGTAALAGIDYALTLHQAPLVVVLGHQPCRILDTVHAQYTRGTVSTAYHGAITAHLGLTLRHRPATTPEDLLDRHLRHTATTLLDTFPVLARLHRADPAALATLVYTPADRLVRPLRTVPVLQS
ncbi:hypothetical protein LO771_21345 [Streptacidiphilus sp. ASG 303]|uniref:carbonic anhydrase n=1 Tax=Streptacidiphilus sp. ASG 303 TaxID=2896847 RepID=UPI001E50757E|nr:carbonic anhydrase [Streptacidiphilus sp. ASG 303]MCD0484866.1 hypothetical protein [Streptacidiphilus sp. ASG 303]